ncbi:MAG: hypothetical protein HC898_12360 [Phycisphaerales bacterium]|nr:hypothetical protein [Phycisphaerales bacterium]
MNHTRKVCGVVTCLMLLGGCAGPRDFLNENDILRRENLQLKTTVDELNHKLESRLDQIAALEQATNPDRPKLPGVEPGDIPVAVSLRYGMYTGAVDTNGDGSDDLIRLYFQPLDQKRRFIPVAADVRVQVVVVTPGSEPLVLADMPFTTADLDRTYRTGVTGTHYTVEVPLPKDMPQDVREVVVDLQVTDAATGRLLSLERSFPIKSK